MIIYGTKGAHVLTTALPGVTCPGYARKKQMSVYSRYAHIYWIPLFPYSKPTFVQCGHCRQAWEENGMPEELRSSAQELKGQTRMPLWQWLGLLLIGGLLAWSIVSSALNAR